MKKSLQPGFTFIELAFGLLLLGLVGVGLVSLFGKYVILNKDAETQYRLQKIRQQLLHYVEVNGYLPCPDSKGSPDGYEDRAGSNAARGCYLEHGRLPWNEIGAPARDGWGNYFYYRINSRGTSDTQTHNLCNIAGAGAFGKSGNLSFSSRLPYLCTSTKIIMCLTNTMRTNIDEDNVCPAGEIKRIVQDSPGSNQIAYTELMYNAFHWNNKSPQPPYLGLFSPPVGGHNDAVNDESSYFLKIYDLNWLDPATLNDPPPVINKTRYSIGAQAVVISFGAQNNGNVWKALTKSTGTIKSTAGSTPEYTCPITIVNTSPKDQLRSRAEIENCDGDENFIYDQTKLIDDQLIWIDHNDIKAALIKGGKV